MKEYIKNSSLNQNFKQEILECLDGSYQGEIVIHLDNCLGFLKKEGFRTWKLSRDEDQKLGNYLKKYISDCIPDFPYQIITEDFCIIFEPEIKYNFTSDQLPIKYVYQDKDLWYIHFSFLDKRPYNENKSHPSHNPDGSRSMDHLGRQHWFSHIRDDGKYFGLPKSECLKLKEIIENKRWSELDMEKYFSKNKKDIFNYIIEHIDSFKMDPVMITKLSPQELENTIL